MARQYGRATRDPLGRDGPGWEVDPNSRLPIWKGEGEPVRRPTCQRYDDSPCPHCPPVKAP